MSFYTFSRVLAFGFCKILYHVEFKGTENIPADRGFILCSNHISDFDPILVGSGVQPQCFFMAKEELFKMPFLSAIFRKLGAFPVARGKGDTAAIDRAVQIVKDGHIVAIFPEGTRSTDGKLLRLKSGAILIAAQTGGDLLPCVVKKERGRFLRKRVIIRYGKIIENTALGITGTIPSEIKKANKLLTDTLTHMLEEPSSN